MRCPCCEWTQNTLQQNPSAPDSLSMVRSPAALRQCLNGGVSFRIVFHRGDDFTIIAHAVVFRSPNISHRHNSGKGHAVLCFPWGAAKAVDVPHRCSYHENSKAGVAEPPLAKVILVVGLHGANEAQTGLGELLLLLLSLADIGVLYSAPSSFGM